MKKLWLTIIIVVALLGVYLYRRPVPPATALIDVPVAPKASIVDLPWPSIGQSAIGAQGYGLLASHKSQTPQPIASVAKIITALAVLQKKPVAAGGQGPVITFNQADADLYDYYYSRDGSIALIKAGEQLSEVQALEAMLLPSGNNVADSLANWAFGSLSAYTVYANGMVKNLGMTHTNVEDASGFTDGTTSTADDLVKLALAALAQPVIAQVVSQQSADLPITGHLRNTNYLLGQDGVFGIKTGNTQKAGGCYLVAAKRQIAGHDVNIIGAVLGAPELNDAITAADNLVIASDSGFKLVTVVHKGQKLDSYVTPWGAKSDVKASQDISLLAWQGLPIKILNGPTELKAPASSGQRSGIVTVTNGQKSAAAPLVLSQSLPGPSWHWRLIHH
jgi:D-alanyl-D-alanine carboxypeptidase (penicillin-binding protein 5/6)